MPMTREKAKARAQEVLDGSYSNRAAYEVLCALWLSYAYRDGWPSIVGGPHGGHKVRTLRPVLEQGRTDVRFSVNYVRRHANMAISRLSPRKLEFRVEAASRMPNDQLAALVGDARLEVHCRDTNSLATLRMAVPWYVVLGSCVIRRVARPRGDQIFLRDEEGNPLRGKGGEALSTQAWSHEWMVCPPFEIVRDPSANSWNFEDEDIIGHEKPVTVDSITRAFPDVTIKTEMTMGKLLEFQSMVAQATGQAMTNLSASKTPGVMLSEWWVRDDRMRGWPWYMLCYRDVGGRDTSGRELNILHFGRNPYWHLPLHHYGYDVVPGSPWCMGVPQQILQVQDATNIAKTSILRTIVWHGGSVFLVKKGSLVSKIEEVLDRRQDKVIEYHESKPERLQPVGLDPTTAFFLQTAPQDFDDALLVAPVQRGITSKRGEPGRAIELKIEQADNPIVHRTDWHEIATNNLLTGTLYDISKTDTLETLHEQLSHRFSMEQLSTLKSQDLSRAGIGVYVARDTLRPKTPTEVRQDYYGAVNSQMIGPDAARRNYLVKTGEALDEREGAAYRRQQMEIQSLLNGRQVPVRDGHYHEMHVWTIDLEMESPRWDSYSPEQIQLIEQHRAEHEEVLLARQAGQRQLLGNVVPTEAGGIPPEQYGQPQNPQTGPAPEGQGYEYGPNSPVAGGVPPPPVGMPQAEAAMAV